MAGRWSSSFCVFTEQDTVKELDEKPKSVHCFISLYFLPLKNCLQLHYSEISPQWSSWEQMELAVVERWLSRGGRVHHFSIIVKNVS